MLLPFSKYVKVANLVAAGAVLLVELTETWTSLQVDPAQAAAYQTSLGISSMVCCC